MSFFDDVETTIENMRVVQTINDEEPPVLKLPAFEGLQTAADKLKGELNAAKLLQYGTLAYYHFKRYLVSERHDEIFSFLKDQDAYRLCAYSKRGPLAQAIVDNYLDVKRESAKTLDVVPELHHNSVRIPTADKVNASASQPFAKKIAERNPTFLEPITTRIAAGDFDQELFNPVIEILGQIFITQAEMDKFCTSPHFQRLVQLEVYRQKKINKDDFKEFRVLGRGAFGMVSFVQKKDTKAIYAMKAMSKKMVKAASNEKMVITEKRVLQSTNSPFVVNLKYSFQTDDWLYLVLELAQGGDIKYHLKPDPNQKGKPFDPARAKFYAAEVLIGLFHMHRELPKKIIYRDLKPNNVLLDHLGHCKISDLGLAVEREHKEQKVLRHLAGTPGYWAPEIMCKIGTFAVSDYWSLGVMLHEMLTGKRPRCSCNEKAGEWCAFGSSDEHEENAQKDTNFSKMKVDVDFSHPSFTPECKDFLTKIFEGKYDKRLGWGTGDNGQEDIKSHPYFKDINWTLMKNLELSPPYEPDKQAVNAASVNQVGELEVDEKVKLEADDQKHYGDFDWTNAEALEKEILQAVSKLDNMAPAAVAKTVAAASSGGGGCCTIL